MEKIAKKHVVTKDLPEEQRPYDRCLLYGAGSLSNRELLAAILQSGSAGLNSLETADLILQACNDKGGISGFYRLSVRELMEIPGIGPAKAARLSCIGELSRRMASSSGTRTRRFMAPEDVADFYMERLRTLDRECIWCLMLDSKNAFLGEQLISQGTVNASLVSPREIFSTALAFKAVSIVLIHNHPSGDATPSREDVASTKRIVQAGELLGIQLMDHIVIGDHCYVSIREFSEDDSVF